MKLRLLGKDSTPTNSPTLYATDQDSYVVQGWTVTDKATLTQLAVADNENLVEIPLHCWSIWLWTAWPGR
jgi:hypothetical protein